MFEISLNWDTSCQKATGKHIWSTWKIILHFKYESRGGEISVTEKNNYMFSPRSLCLISQEKKKYADKALIAEGRMRAVIGPQLAELVCRFVIILSLQWAFKNHPEMVSHFSHLEMEKLHQISSTVQRNTGAILQASSQPSHWQQAPLFSLCPSEKSLSFNLL